MHPPKVSTLETLCPASTTEQCRAYTPKNKMWEWELQAWPWWIPLYWLSWPGAWAHSHAPSTGVWGKAGWLTVTTSWSSSPLSPLFKVWLLPSNSQSLVERGWKEAWCFSFHFVAEINHSGLGSLGEERVPLVTPSGSQYILERSLVRNISRSLRRNYKWMPLSACVCLAFLGCPGPPCLGKLLLPQWVGTF